VDRTSPLNAELHTVELLIASQATTRLTDAFTLLYVKSEKQLRKIFVFIAYQSEQLQKCSANEINATVASFKHLQSKQYIKGINEIYYRSFSDVFGTQYSRLNTEIDLIRATMRNKILHGQPTGLSLREPQMEKGIALMREWIVSVFEGFHAEIGFGGFERNTFRKAKWSSERLIKNFDSSAEFSSYLKAL
jgi:hypothetical protein